MTLYVQLQRAHDIMAEHEREAAKIRLARLYDESSPAPLAEAGRHSPIRRAIGGGVLAFGEAVTRVGRALDDAESSPSA